MNNPVRFTPLFAIIVLYFSSCQRPLIVDDDPTGSGGAKWQLIDYQSERLILGLHATPFEWYLISENQFARFDGDNGLLEKRPLDLGSGIRGIPVMSDNTFFRLGANEDGRDLLEFHLTKSPAEIIKIPLDSLADDNGEVLQVEYFARSLGVYSDDGTLFMLPVQVLPANHYAFLVFEIRLNQPANGFVSVEKIRRIEVEELKADYGSIKSMRYLNGVFYIATEEGAWRITGSGAASRIFTQSLFDFFSWQGDLYFTGFNTFDLHKSTDNGLNWERLNKESDLKYAEPRNLHVFTNEESRKHFLLMSDDLLTARQIIYPAEVKIDNPVFYGVAFFAGRYYFSVDRKVYFTEDVVTR